MIRFLSQFAAAFLCIVPISLPAETARSPERAQAVTDKSWFREFATQKRELAAERADVCFAGDSLTAFWKPTGQAIWELEFHDLRAVNFGIAGDRTENILYRLTRALPAAQPPRAFVLLAGTNNLAQDPPDSPEATVAAIQIIVKYLAKQCPESKILLLNLPPNGHEPDSPLRRRVLETNRLLSKLTLPKQAMLIDIYSVFAGKDHRWKRGMTIDGTHFSQHGYDHLGRTISTELKFLKPQH